MVMRHVKQVTLCTVLQNGMHVTYEWKGSSGQEGELLVGRWITVMSNLSFPTSTQSSD